MSELERVHAVSAGGRQKPEKTVVKLHPHESEQHTGNSGGLCEAFVRIVCVQIVYSAPVYLTSTLKINTRAAHRPRRRALG